MPNFSLQMKAPRKAVIRMYDTIGPAWAGGIDATIVSNAINDAGPLDQIEVRINCPGGSLYEGIAIYNILKTHSAKVHTAVDGIAASMGSVVLLAGDTREVPKNAFVMIHDPSIMVAGTEADLTRAMDALVKGKAAIIETYVSRTGQAPDALTQMMAAETWMNGEEAVAKGFATTMTKEITLPVTAMASSLSATVGGFTYSRPPEHFSSLFSLAMNVTSKEIESMAEKTQEQLDAEVKAAADLKATNDAAVKALADKQAADVKNAQDSERQRAAEIMAVCNQIKRPDLAAEFIANGSDLATVKDKAIQVMCAERPPVDDGPGDRQTKTTDPHAAYKKEYADQKAYFTKHGTSENDYVQSRIIDAEQAARAV